MSGPLDASDAALPPGTMVGEYQIETMIGAGTFGQVYAAVHPIIGKRVAVKVLEPRLAASEEMVSRFVAEARAVNRIQHRHIIDIFAFGTLDDGLHYFVMELLEGQTLQDHLAASGPLSLSHAAPILEAVAQALEAAHAQGIVHRDLKPENVFLVHDEDGRVFPKLLDFGVAKLLGDAPVGHRTGSGVPLGTPLYMSPEQCRGGTVDHRSDIYAFGVMAFEMLSGQRPFDGGSVAEIMMAHLSEEPPPLSRVRPDLPPALDAALLRMMAKRPRQRPSSITEALAALLHAGATGPRREPPPPVATSTEPCDVDPLGATAPTALLKPPAATVDPWGATHAGPALPSAEGAAPAAGHGGRKLAWGVSFVVLMAAGAATVVAQKPTSTTTEAPAKAKPRDPGPGGVEVGHRPLPAGATLDEKLDYLVDGVFTGAGAVTAWKNHKTMRRTIHITRSDDYLVQEAEVRFHDYRTVTESSVDDHPEPPVIRVKPQANQNFIASTRDGKRLTITPLGGGAGGGSDLPEALRDELQRELLRHFEPRQDVFRRPLAVGDVVEPPSELMGHVLGADDHDGTMVFQLSRLTFTGRGEKAGRALARFDVATHLSEKTKEGAFEADLNGVVALDLETGWPTTVNVEGLVTGYVLNDEVRMDLEGKASIVASSIITTR